jgi:hypothetical protein
MTDWADVSDRLTRDPQNRNSSARVHYFFGLSAWKSRYFDDTLIEGRKINGTEQFNMHAIADSNIAFFALPSGDQRQLTTMTLIAKSTFSLSGQMERSAKSPSTLNMSDVFLRSDCAASIVSPSDLCATKPYADLLFSDAFSRSVKIGGCKQWIASVEIVTSERKRKKEYMVYGPRNWRRSLINGWALSSSRQSDEVPFDYETAFGGRWMSSPRYYPENPVGRGFCLLDPCCDASLAPAHQIEELGKRVMCPSEAEPFEGLFAIGPSWSPRRQFGGRIDFTGDDVSPIVNTGFSSQYNNCAPTWLQFEHDELDGASVILANIGPLPRMEIVLPAAKVWFLVRDDGFLGTPDTYVINLHEDCVDVTWRVDLPYDPHVQHVTCIFEIS